jgi:hypothetical protein
MARDRIPREQISAGLRFAVLSRCNFACYYCGTPAALGLKVLHVDHVVPVQLGGTNDPWNLVAACWDCNLGKSGIAPTAELIERVRTDYESYMAVSGRGRVCRLCHLSFVPAEGDEAYDHCMSCVDRDFAIYDLGFKAAGGDH